MANLLPAWLPPLITLNAGTGIIISLWPAKSAICLYNGTPRSAAPALHTAIEMPRIAFAPNLAIYF